MIKAEYKTELYLKSLSPYNEALQTIHAKISSLTADSYVLKVRQMTLYDIMGHLRSFKNVDFIAVSGTLSSVLLQPLGYKP